MNYKSLGIDASLPIVDHSRYIRLLHSQINITVFQYDEGVRAAELEAALLHMCPRLCRNQLP